MTLREVLYKCREEFCWHGNTGKHLSADTYAALVDMIDKALDSSPLDSSPSEADQPVVLATEKGLTTTGQHIADCERDAARYRHFRNMVYPLAGTSDEANKCFDEEYRFNDTDGRMGPVDRERDHLDPPRDD